MSAMLHVPHQYVILADSIDVTSMKRRQITGEVFTLGAVSSTAAYDFVYNKKHSIAHCRDYHLSYAHTGRLRIYSNSNIYIYIYIYIYNKFVKLLKDSQDSYLFRFFKGHDCKKVFNNEPSF